MGLLDKIKQEAEAPTVRVPPRSDELAPPVPLASEKGSGVAEPGIDFWEEELGKYPVVSAKKVGVRLEEEILKELQQLCQQHDITVETLLESFYVNCQGNENLMRRVVKEAQHRIKRRVEAGNIRSLITKSKNMSQRS